MFGFNLFDRSGGSSFSYDKSLISGYKKDHQKLVKLLTCVVNEEKSNNIRKFLSEFRTELLGHLLSEDVRLYRHLREYYKNDKSTLELILEYEKSIKEIQKEVLSFIDFYLSPKKIFDKTFDAKLADIVSALLTRISTEESSLYMLYKK